MPSLAPNVMELAVYTNEQTCDKLLAFCILETRLIAATSPVSLPTFLLAPVFFFTGLEGSCSLVGSWGVEVGLSRLFCSIWCQSPVRIAGTSQPVESLFMLNFVFVWSGALLLRIHNVVAKVNGPSHIIRRRGVENF